MTLDINLDKLATAIKTAPDLWDLRDALAQFEKRAADIASNEDRDVEIENTLAHYGINIAELPTFGGSEPDNTIDVWSWDAEHLLMGTGPFREWTIEERAA